jgi:hypothetical protein
LSKLLTGTFHVNGKSTFLLGTGIGIGVAAVIFFLFVYILLYPFSNLVLSGVTFLGIGLAAGGYFSHWKGDRSFTTFFILGLGIGITLVSFIGAGYGSIFLV